MKEENKKVIDPDCVTYHGPLRPEISKPGKPQMWLTPAIIAGLSYETILHLDKYYEFVGGADTAKALEEKVNNQSLLSA